MFDAEFLAIYSCSCIYLSSHLSHCHTSGNLCSISLKFFLVPFFFPFSEELMLNLSWTIGYQFSFLCNIEKNRKITFPCGSVVYTLKDKLKKSFLNNSVLLPCRYVQNFFKFRKKGFRRSFQLEKMTNFHIIWLHNKSNSVLHSLAVLLRLPILKDIFSLNFESIAH